MTKKYRSNMSLEAFVSQCHSEHNHTYDYSMISDIRLSKKIPIICPSHGMFMQMAHNHLDGAKCPRCVDDASKGASNPTFKKMEKEVLNLPVQGITNLKVIPKSLGGATSTQVEFLCEKHGLQQTSLYRLKNHLSCPICKHEDKFPVARAKPAYLVYSKVVWYYTNWHWQQHRKFIDHYGYKRSVLDHHLDHVYSIAQGFQDGIPAWIIGHWTNLWLTPAKLNSAKGSKCDKSQNQLFLDYDWAKRNFNQKDPVPYRSVFIKRSTYVV